MRQEPDDQKKIPHPRIGYHGAINDQIDFELLDSVAKARADFQFILLGDTKALSTKLPKRENIHYLNSNNKFESSHYVSGWDCSILPLKEDLDRKLVELKILELLKEAKPIVSTYNRSKMRSPWCSSMSYFSSHPPHLVECIERAMNERAYDPEWFERVEHFLEFIEAEKLSPTIDGELYSGLIN